MTVSSFARSRVESDLRHEDHFQTVCPPWAVWNDSRAQRYTLGVEEEVMLLDPDSWSLAQASDDVLARLSDDLACHVSPETHAAVVELVTGVYSSIDGLAAELTSLRERLASELRTMGLAVAAAGTHPLALREETELSGTERYHQLGESLRGLARREPTMALHVHIGVPAPDDAVRLLNALCRHAPVLLALSGNSPFWRARDGGYASTRTVIFQAFPRTGLPRPFASYAEYVDAIHPLVGSGAIADSSYLWWDVRLQPNLGTVELRVMDAQSTLDDVQALVALVQSLARRELEDGSPGVTPTEVLAENRFLAARDGMDARLIDPTTRGLVPVVELLERLLDECRPHALALGCAAELEQVPQLARATGADRQRDFIAHDARLDHLVANLAERFNSPGLTATTDRSA